MGVSVAVLIAGLGCLRNARPASRAWMPSTAGRQGRILTFFLLVKHTEYSRSKPYLTTEYWTYSRLCTR